MPGRHRSSIYLSIWSLIDPLTLLCPNSSAYLLSPLIGPGKHSRVEPITYTSVQHTINNRFWCQLPWAAQCIMREFGRQSEWIEWMITSPVSQKQTYRMYEHRHIYSYTRTQCDSHYTLMRGSLIKDLIQRNYPCFMLALNILNDLQSRQLISW